MKKKILKNCFYFLRRIWLYIAILISFFIKKEINNKKKLLIVRTDSIGDFIIFSPAIKYIKEIYPDYTIYLIANKSISDLLLLFPEIDNYIPLDIRKFTFNFFYYLKIILKLRKLKFDIVLNPIFSRSIFSDELVQASIAKEKIGFLGDTNNIPGFIRDKNNKFYTKLIKFVPQKDTILELYKTKIFLENLNHKYKNKITLNELKPNIKVPREYIEKAKETLRKNNWQGSNYVVVHPGAGQFYRMWPIERFVEIIKFLKEKNYEIVITGDKNDKWIIDYIKLKVPDVIDLISKTDLLVVAGVLSLAKFYFGSDTGILHLAAAVNTPTICILGGGHFGRFFPYGNTLKNRIIYDKNMKCKNDNWECAKNNIKQAAPCIDAITTKDAMNEINDLIKFL